MPGTPAQDVIPNRVFIGCPWKTVRTKYERAIDKLKKKYPIAFAIVGRGDGQDAEDLLTVIKQRLLSSSYAVFDASGGNANVSLEFGLAEAHEIKRALYLCIHGATSRSGSRDSPIIADLAGKKQNRYKQEQRLVGLLSAMCKSHDFTKRFERFFQDSFRNAAQGKKKRSRALALKVIHALDETGSRRRTDLVQELLAGPVRYKESEINDMILKLHRAELVLSKQGPYSTVSIR